MTIQRSTTTWKPRPTGPRKPIASCEAKATMTITFSQRERGKNVMFQYLNLPWEHRYCQCATTTSSNEQNNDQKLTMPSRHRGLFISIVFGLSILVVAFIGRESREFIQVPVARFLAKRKAATGSSNEVLPTIATTIHQDENKPPHKAVRFLFTIGIEGTGHHLVQSMVMANESPLLQRLKQLQIYPEWTRRMSRLLYAGKTHPTLWGSMTTCGNQSDIVLVEDQLVQVLQTIERKAKNATTIIHNQQPDIINIPFNTMRTFSSMVSYPHMLNACRQLEYPDLDLFYQVCNRANVQCDHIYIYRDPYEVLYSTTVKRNFNRKIPHLLPVIHLYKSMLKIIYAQLADHANRTIGCFGMFEPGQESRWKYQLGDILGWTNQKEYDEFFDIAYSPPTSNSSKYREPFEKEELASAMKSFTETHERVRLFCESTVQGKMPPPSMLLSTAQ